METYTKDNLTIYNANCMDIMAQYEDSYFDLAVVDPPYGIGMSGGNVGYDGNNHLPRKEWDNQVPNEMYFTEIKRVSRNQIIWGGIISVLYGLLAVILYGIRVQGLGGEHTQSVKWHLLHLAKTQKFLVMTL